MRVAILAIAAGLAGLASTGELAAQGTPSPHGRLRTSVPCEACHTTDGWRPLRDPLAFSHAADAGFPLTGAHVRAPCRACHLDARFDEPRATPDQCAVCHLEVHQGRLGDDCLVCHDTESFQGAARIRAHARTTFPLTGAHLRVDCEACHTDDRAGAFTRLDPSCLACHAEAFQATTFPDHEALGYPADCRGCHAAASWRGARFDHTSTGFDLVGAHAGMACVLCHRPPDNAPIAIPAGADDCVACHAADYQREHAGTGYPTTCTTCHTPDRWSGISFDHDGFFPIFSGAHDGEWSTCLDCHAVPGDFSIFTCLTCHTRGETDSHHEDVQDYVYESTQCLRCHPRGDED